MHRAAITCALIATHAVTGVSAECEPGTIVACVLGTFFGCAAVVGAALLLKWFHDRKRRRVAFSGSPKSAASCESHVNGAFSVDCVDARNGIRLTKGALVGSHVGEQEGKSGCNMLEYCVKRPSYLGNGHTAAAALDDTCQPLQACYSVNLMSKDIIGLGFNISSNYRDGVVISNLYEHGPAKESGLVSVGDRIVSVTISFENITYEDAVAILSCGSPYRTRLHLLKHQNDTPSQPQGYSRQLSTNSSQQLSTPWRSQLLHPVFGRSQSLIASSTAAASGLEAASVICHVASVPCALTVSKEEILTKNKFGHILNLNSSTSLLPNNGSLCTPHLPPEGNESKTSIQRNSPGSKFQVNDFPGDGCSTMSSIMSSSFLEGAVGLPMLHGSEPSSPERKHVMRVDAAARIGPPTASCSSKDLSVDGSIVNNVNTNHIRRAEVSMSAPNDVSSGLVASNFTESSMAGLSVTSTVTYGESVKQTLVADPAKAASQRQRHLPSAVLELVQRKEAASMAVDQLEALTLARSSGNQGTKKTDGEADVCVQAVPDVTAATAEPQGEDDSSILLAVLNAGRQMTAETGVDTEKQSALPTASPTFEKDAFHESSCDAPDDDSSSATTGNSEIRALSARIGNKRKGGGGLAGQSHATAGPNTAMHPLSRRDIEEARASHFSGMLHSAKL